MFIHSLLDISLKVSRRIEHNRSTATRSYRASNDLERYTGLSDECSFQMIINVDSATRLL